ncbi:MAG: enoyl-ACP reductase [Firmicutes bacterium]|nr:enoyl-ACP reductase [Bacillota bacterium]
MLDGKVGLVLGVANQHSLAWHISKALADARAQLILTVQGERFEKRLKKLVAEAGFHQPPLLLPCDVQDDRQIEDLYTKIKEKFPRLDFLVHSIAYAEKEDLAGKFVDTSRRGFQTALEISAYSLLAVTRPALPLMKEGGSIVTLTYLGSQRAVPHYNVMGVAKAALESAVRYLAYDLGAKGIRVNALSPGPVNTLSARGIKGFTDFLGHVRANAPLQQNIAGREVGDAALFLCSDLARGITGETIFVDAGYHLKGS